MMTRPLDPIAKGILRRAGKARLTVLVGRRQITIVDAAHVLAAYREQVSPCR